MLAIEFKKEWGSNERQERNARSEHLPLCARFLKLTSFCKEPESLGAKPRKKAVNVLELVEHLAL